MRRSFGVERNSSIKHAYRLIYKLGLLINEVQTQLSEPYDAEPD